jgi:hypothetical protein
LPSSPSAAGPVPRRGGSGRAERFTPLAHYCCRQSATPALRCFEDIGVSAYKDVERPEFERLCALVAATADTPENPICRAERGRHPNARRGDR